MSLPLSHVPVLRDAVLHHLMPRTGGIYVDGTFGRGGYSAAILAAKPAQLFAIDRDPDAIAAGAVLQRAHTSLTLIEGCFGAMDTLLATRGVTAVDGIALDLGVSSPQLDDATRGFSFRADGPLDMRMGADGPTAADIVNHADEAELARIIFVYGEEKCARRVARAIVTAREDGPITRTLQLATLVRRVVPAAKDGIDPATRTFQALRIAANDELGELERGLAAAEKLLRPEGRLVVVSFHSLEDRCVKDFIRARSARAAQGSRHAPANDRTAPSFVELTRKPVTADSAELAANPRARSARLRAAQRLATGGTA